MDPMAGFELKQKMLSPTRMVILPGSGHHVYIDNSDMFNKSVLMSMKGTLPDVDENRLESLVKKRKR